MASTRALLVLILTLSVTTTASAYEHHGLGPAAGEIRSSLASPWEAGSWYVGTPLGLYHLPSGGASWEFASGGLPRGTVTTICAVPLQTDFLYVGVSGYPTNYGVYRTLDGGQNWEATNTGLGNLAVNAVACDPSTTTHLYAGTEGGVYKTTNGGDAWTLSGLAGESIRDCVVDPSDPTVAWASVAWNGIYRTTDSGGSWQPSSNGMSGNLLFYDIKASATGDTLYAVGWETFRSFDGGENWTEIGEGTLPPSGTYIEAALLPGDASTILLAYFGGEIYRSDDCGETWVGVAPDVLTGLVEYESISASPLSPGRFLIGAMGGEVFITPDLGENWMSWTSGISTAWVLSLDVADSRWLAGTIRGVFVSEDYGRTWEKSDFIYDVGAEINSIAIHPTDPMTAYCGNTNGFFKGDVYRSTDGGWLWNLIKHGDGPVEAVAIDPIQPLNVYAGYSCDVAPGGIYRSTNGGASWITESLGSVCVYCLQIDPSNPAVVMAGTSSGVYRSTDYGDTWSARGPAGIAVVDLCGDDASPTRFYAATYGARAYASDDGGLSWSPFGGTGLPVNLYSIEGRDPATGVLAGSATTGIWEHDGVDWVRLDDADQPPVGQIHALLALPDMGRFLAGTRGAGIWEYLSDPADAPDVNAQTFAASIAILGSPSAGPFTVRFALPRASAVAIDLFDLAGRRIRTYRDANALTSGRIDWSWDGRDEAGRPLPTGVYFARIRTDQGAAIGKIVLAR